MYNTYNIYIYAHGGAFYDHLFALNQHLPLEIFRAILY